MFAKGTVPFAIISILDVLEAWENSESPKNISSGRNSRDDKNPCQLRGSKSKNASKNLLVPGKSSFRRISIPKQKNSLCLLLSMGHKSFQTSEDTRRTNRKKSSGKPNDNDSDWQSYRNVQELKAAGIHVNRSEAKTLGGMSFSRRLNFYPGFLSLPPLIVDDSTGPKLLNLIAYEMCLDFKNDFGITSYVSFLDSLIDEANDVKELRKAHVLFNLLGSDEEVAQLFNEIGTDLVPDLGKYTKVKTQIQEYYDKTWVRWVAEFFHNNFSSPWTLLAFLGALFALALSATQTWYAVDSPPGPCDKFCEKFNQNLRKG